MGLYHDEERRRGKKLPHFTHRKEEFGVRTGKAVQRKRALIEGIRLKTGVGGIEKGPKTKKKTR